MAQLSQDQIVKLREQALNDHFFFCKAILGLDKLTNLHKEISQFICDHSVSKKKLVLIPRNHFKTRLITIGYVMWRIVKNPDITCLICNENDGNVEEWIMQMERNFESNQLLRLLFPDILPEGYKPITWSRRAFVVNRKSLSGTPTVEGVGVKSAVTSKHRDLIIEDDLISKDAIDCADTMKKAVEYHKLIESCFDDESGYGEELVVGTRWAKHDLYDYIMKEEPDFQVYCRKAVENGKPILPERFDIAKLQQLRKRLGTFFYSCQYSNDPRDPDDVMLKDEWPQKFMMTDGGQVLIPATGEIIEMPSFDIASVADTAHSEKVVKLLKSSKNTVVVMGIDSKERVFLFDYYAKRGSRDPFIEKIFTFNKIWRPRCCGVEAIGYQSQLKKDCELKALEKKQDIYFKPLYPQGGRFGRGSKLERIKIIIPYLERGDFYIRQERDNEEFWEEYQSYPSEQVSLDILDCIAYGLTILQVPDKYGDWVEEQEDIDTMNGMNPMTGY